MRILICICTPTIPIYVCRPVRVCTVLLSIVKKENKNLFLSPAYSHRHRCVFSANLPSVPNNLTKKCRKLAAHCTILFILVNNLRTGLFFLVTGHWWTSLTEVHSHSNPDFQIYFSTWKDSYQNSYVKHLVWKLRVYMAHYCYAYFLENLIFDRSQ